MRRIMANDNDDNTDTSTYDTSVTKVSDVDALVMMPVAIQWLLIMMFITRRLPPNHGNCVHSDVDNDPDNDNDRWSRSYSPGGRGAGNGARSRTRFTEDLTANGKTPLLYFRQCETWANPRVKEK